MFEAVNSLLDLQVKAKRIELHKLTKPISIGSSWREGRINFPNNLGQAIGISAPALSITEISDLLSINPDTFVKWDARSGNAILGSDGKLSWFDWEHWGTRCSIDDLVWFLSDERVPSNSDIDKEIIEESRFLFNSVTSQFSPQRYLLVHGSLHMCGRLNKLLRHKGEKKWWD